MVGCIIFFPGLKHNTLSVALHSNTKKNMFTKLTLIYIKLVKEQTILIKCKLVIKKIIERAGIVGFLYLSVIIVVNYLYYLSKY